MNTTAAISIANWHHIQGRLVEARATVHNFLLANGPATTAGIAAGTGLSILTVRPRVTELCQLGFAELSGKIAREGVYAAIPVERARENWQHAREVAAGTPRQAEFAL